MMNHSARLILTAGTVAGYDGGQRLTLLSFASLFLPLSCLVPPPFIVFGLVAVDLGAWCYFPVHGSDRILTPPPPQSKFEEGSQARRFVK